MLAKGCLYFTDRHLARTRVLRGCDAATLPSGEGCSHDAQGNACFLIAVCCPPGGKQVENSMRPIAIGRRNWLHLGSKEAGPRIAAIFSIVESCRKLGIPIRKYLADVLPGIADRSIKSLASITPPAYAAKIVG